MKKSRVFGGSSTVLSPSYDPMWLCWRTCQTSFDWAEPMSLDRLPKSGMTVNGRLYRLDNSVRPTYANDGLVLPTQKQSDSIWTMNGVFLPTPTTSQDYKPIRSLSPSEKNGTHGKSLVAAIGDMMEKNLLPTPTVNESKNNPSGASQWARNGSLNVEAAKLAGLNKTTGKGFQLNPQFVEEMMGFPIGWTELKPLETQSSHSAQNGSDNKS